MNSFSFRRTTDSKFLKVIKSPKRRPSRLISRSNLFYSIAKPFFLEINHCLPYSRASWRSFPDETTLSMTDYTDYKGSRVRRPDVGLTIRPDNLIAANNITRREITRRVASLEKILSRDRNVDRGDPWQMIDGDRERSVGRWSRRVCRC